MKTTITIVQQCTDLVIKTDKGLVWNVGNNLSSTTALAACLFQTVNCYFDALELVSSDFEIELSLDWENRDLKKP